MRKENEAVAHLKGHLVQRTSARVSRNFISELKVDVTNFRWQRSSIRLANALLPKSCE